jgi:hypothetical protein
MSTAAGWRRIYSAGVRLVSAAMLVSFVGCGGPNAAGDKSTSEWFQRGEEARDDQAVISGSYLPALECLIALRESDLGVMPSQVVQPGDG